MMSRVQVGLVVLCLLVAGCVTRLRAEGPGDEVPGRFDEYGMLMLERPKLELIPGQELGFPAGLVDLWMRALKRDEPEFQRLIIDTMAMAHAENLQGLEVATERLVALASDEKQDLDVLRASVQTLIVLDIREHQDLFANLALAKGAPISEIVEPALAQWGSKAMEDAWLKRVQEQAASPSQMILAMNGLAAIKCSSAGDALQTLVLNSSALRRVRLAAAEALASIAPQWQVDLASKLHARTPGQLLDSLMALSVLKGSQSQEAVDLLEKIVQEKNQNSAVLAGALEQLYSIDYKLLLPHVRGLVTSRDSSVRLWCARALADARKSEDIPVMAGLLNDLNPGLRSFMSGSLVDFGKTEELRPAVIGEVEKILAGTNWRGCEQACVVLGRLDHEPAAERMVELLGNPRGDVKVAAAWGLTQLRVAAVLPDMLDHAESVYEGLSSKQLNAGMPGVTLHLAHLFIAFGDQNYTESEPLLVKMIPKSYDYGEFARPAAVWALGVFHQNEPDCPLVPKLVDRLLDDFSMVPEIELVRIMCAVSLGRMKAASANADLVKFSGQTNLLGSATRWGIREITGDEVPLPKQEVTSNTKNQWFLTPLTPESD